MTDELFADELRDRGHGRHEKQWCLVGALTRTTDFRDMIFIKTHIFAFYFKS